MTFTPASSARWINAEASALLASCAASPPPTRIVPVGDGSYRTLYRGREAQRLRRIHHAECARLLKLGDETGDYRAFRACCEMTAEAAIRAAVSTPKAKAA